MRGKNCPNCGAPYDASLNKCPYCDTSYYDLSALDLTAREPFYLKIKTEIDGQPCYITQLVRYKPDMSIEISSETDDIYDVFGNSIRTFIRNRTMTTNISFEAVMSQSHKNLCTIEVLEG